MTRKMIPLSRLRDKQPVDVDSVAKDNRSDNNCSDLLFKAQMCWNALETFRRDRNRSIQYVYGDQWGDKVKDRNGNLVTEGEILSDKGNVPLVNNLCGRFIRTLEGIYLQQDNMPTVNTTAREEQAQSEVLTTALRTCWGVNSMNVLKPRAVREMAIGGLPIHKKTVGFRNGNKFDCYTTEVNPNYFFVENTLDPRGWDINMIGEIHDLSFADLMSEFCVGDPGMAEKLKAEYLHQGDDYRYSISSEQQNEKFKSENVSFLAPIDHTKCRVIEVWTVETREAWRCTDPLQGDYYIDDFDNKPNILAENQERLRLGLEQGIPKEEIPFIEYEYIIDKYWYYRFLTPYGNCIMEGESPYDHKEHPYVYVAYPNVDGRIHSFISGVIDQQRYINRLVTMYDMIMRSSAKGIVAVPSDTVPDTMTMEDFAEEWTKSDGLLLYTPKPHRQIPTQIANNATNIGINDLLKTQLSLMEDESGITSALQGKQNYSGMSSALYSQQKQQASASLLGILQTISEFEKKSAEKDLSNIQQYYTDKKMLKSKSGFMVYDPRQVRDLESEVTISESQDTPTLRALGNDLLLTLFDKQAINVKMLLECGSFPNADNLLHLIQKQEEEMKAAAEQQQQQQLTAPQPINNQQSVAPIAAQ